MRSMGSAGFGELPWSRPVRPLASLFSNAVGRTDTVFTCTASTPPAGGDRVRAHVFLCMLAYYVEWHLCARRGRRCSLPRVTGPGPTRGSPVKPAARSERADAKAESKRPPAGQPVHRFRGLLDQFATLTKNRIQPAGDLPTFDRLSVPTPMPQEAFDLLGIFSPVYPETRTPGLATSSAESGIYARRGEEHRIREHTHLTP